RHAEGVARRCEAVATEERRLGRLAEKTAAAGGLCKVVEGISGCEVRGEKYACLSVAEERRRHRRARNSRAAEALAWPPPGAGQGRGLLAQFPRSRHRARHLPHAIERERRSAV